MKKSFCCLAVILLVLLSSCSTKINSEAPYSRLILDATGDQLTEDSVPPVSQIIQFTDSMGNTVSVSDPGRTIVCSGSFAQVWILAGGELIGATSDFFEDGFADAIGVADTDGVAGTGSVADVGGPHDPSMEQILALQPEFIILSADIAGHVKLRETLESAGIQTAYFSVESFDDYLSMLKICTDITGRKDLYAENGERIMTEINAIIAKAKDKPSPKILLVRTGAGKVTARGGDTMAGTMLKDMGCVNIADSNNSLLSELSMEIIIEENPDFIFAVAMGDEDKGRQLLEESLQNNPAWNNLSAVKNNHYMLLPKDLFHQKPNNRWAESYEYLWDVLYGK